METKDPNALPDIKQAVIIAAPIQKVWETVSTSEGISSWFMPNDIQLELGHEFHLQSPFGPSPCKVIAIEAPHRLSFTWDTEGWVVSFLLNALDDKTEFTLIHGGWKQEDELVSKAKEKNSVIRNRMEQGWAGIVDNLRKGLES